MSHSTKLPALVVALLSCACGAARQSAATQPTPAAFDPAKSDPKAVAVADQMIAALGGEAAWQKAHEITWMQSGVTDGKLVDVVEHSWDRWNARHRFVHYDASGKQTVAMYEMFSAPGTGYATFGGQKAAQADKLKLLEEARKRFASDAYPLSVPFKVKDPGVHLKLEEERPEDVDGKIKPGSPMKYDVIQLTFDAGVGDSPKDQWYIVVEKATHLPSSIEHHLAGAPENEVHGYKLEGWTTAGGLKIATMRKTLGYTTSTAPVVPVDVRREWKEIVGPEVAGMKLPNPGEIVVVSSVKVNAEPTDASYIPAVQ